MERIDTVTISHIPHTIWRGDDAEGRTGYAITSGSRLHGRWVENPAPPPSITHYSKRAAILSAVSRHDGTLFGQYNFVFGAKQFPPTLPGEMLVLGTSTTVPDGKWCAVAEWSRGEYRPLPGLYDASLICLPVGQRSVVYTVHRGAVTTRTMC